eukprot:6437884-Heterocapsa_arctica.AAC.1
MHRRAKTTKKRLNKYKNDKTDEGDTDNIDNIGEVEIDGNSNVNKHIKSFQSRIDLKNERTEQRT